MIIFEFNSLENKVADDFEDPSIVEVPDWQVEWDIFVGIDTVAVALVDREADSIAVAMELDQRSRLVAVHPCMAPDFDPMDKVIVLVMGSPAGD